MFGVILKWGKSVTIHRVVPLVNMIYILHDKLQQFLIMCKNVCVLSVTNSSLWGKIDNLKSNFTSEVKEFCLTIGLTRFPFFLKIYSKYNITSTMISPIKQLYKMTNITYIYQETHWLLWKTIILTTGDIKITYLTIVAKFTCHIEKVNRI